jgi:hypothetical protein
MKNFNFWKSSFLLSLLVFLIVSCSQVENTPNKPSEPTLDADIPPATVEQVDLEALVKANIATKFRVPVQAFDANGNAIIMSQGYSTYADCYGWVGVAAYPFSPNAYGRVYLRCPGYQFTETFPDSWIAITSPTISGKIYNAYKRLNEKRYDFIDVLSNSVPKVKGGTYTISGKIGGHAKINLNGLTFVINPYYHADREKYTY